MYKWPLLYHYNCLKVDPFWIIYFWTTVITLLVKVVMEWMKEKFIDLKEAPGHNGIPF